MRKWSSLKNSPRASIEFASEIDRASLASVTLEGSCHDFSRVEWRSIGRKSKAVEPSKERVSRPNRRPEEKETGHLSSLLHQWFSPANLSKLLFTSGNHVIAGYQPGLHPRNNVSSAHAYRVKYSLFQEEEVLANSSPKDFFVEKNRSRCDIQWQTSLFGKARSGCSGR